MGLAGGARPGSECGACLDFAPTAAAFSLPRLDSSDDPRYPRFKDALAHAQIAELGPGDAVYIPPVWWHHVESLERLNALVNYWWRPAAFPGHIAEPGLTALMHCILAIKSLPQAEREAWRALLDHFVFADDVAAVADERGQAAGGTRGGSNVGHASSLTRGSINP